MKPLFLSGICISAVALSLVVGCANQERMQPRTPAITTTTTGPAPSSTTPNNDGSTPTHINALPPPEHQPDSQGGPGPMSSMEGSANGSGALSDTTTGPVPHNSSDVTGGTVDSVKAAPTPLPAAPAPAVAMSDADRKTTARIRKALDQSSALSFGAKNVTIETYNGKVTLRGAVKSEREKSLVETEAGKVAGPSHVDDQLIIAK